MYVQTGDTPRKLYHWDKYFFIFVLKSEISRFYSKAAREF
jgi:hypothetical protein